MAETNIYKTLYQGFLSNVEATFATVPGTSTTKGWIVRLITVINTDSASRTYTLHKNGTTDAFLIGPALCSLGAGEMDVYDEVRGCAGADFFSGLASVTNKVTVLIEGDEVTL